MTNKSYEIITVGGGLGGAALAKVMTERSAGAGRGTREAV